MTSLRQASREILLRVFISTKETPEDNHITNVAVTGNNYSWADSNGECYWLCIWNMFLYHSLYIIIYTELAMMTSCHGNTFRVTDTLYGESTGHQWIPLTKSKYRGLWGFFGVRLNKCMNKRLNRRLRRYNAHATSFKLIWIQYTSNKIAKWTESDFQI